MDIIKALKTENIRISCVRRWLFWHDSFQEWIVLERKFGARKNITLYAGESLEKALDALVGEGDD